MFIELGLALALAGIVSVIFCRLAIYAGMWDMPTQERQAHREPTPTGGGLGVGVGFGAGVLALCLWPDAQWCSLIGPAEMRRLGFVVGSAYLFLVIGFVDDAFTLGPRVKLAVFVAAALGATLGVGPAETLPIGAGLSIELGFAIGLAGSCLWAFTLINCVNFMDGANGLSMGSVALGLVALALISLCASAPASAALALCGAGALTGFLVWNFPNGKLFAGDSGALFAGALAAFVSLLAIREGGISPFVPPMLFFPLLADALLTLAWRASKRRKLLIGHSEHLYQVGMRAGMSHAKIAITYWLVTVHCGAVGFLASEVWRAARANGSAAAGIATYIPVIALGMLAIVAAMVSAATRRYAAARGLERA